MPARDAVWKACHGLVDVKTLTLGEPEAVSEA